MRPGVRENLCMSARIALARWRYIRLRQYKKNSISREKIAARAQPGALSRAFADRRETRVGLYSALTPLVRATLYRRGARCQRIVRQDDSVNHPTFSYRGSSGLGGDSKAIELVSTPFLARRPVFLANSVAANAAKAGLDCNVFIPDGLEQGKSQAPHLRPKTVANQGNYDDVNRFAPRSRQIPGLLST